MCFFFNIRFSNSKSESFSLLLFQKIGLVGQWETNHFIGMGLNKIHIEQRAQQGNRHLQKIKAGLSLLKVSYATLCNFNSIN